MKSSLWVICGVTLLCFAQVRCSRNDDEDYGDILDKTSHEDEVTPEKEEDIGRKSHSSFDVLDDLTKKFGKEYRIQNAVTATECDKQNPRCTETGGSCTADGNILKCNCPGGVTRTDATGCKITATECDKQNPRCAETGGSCAADGNTLKCNCPGGVTRTDTTGCDITATECDKQNPRCTETGGSCTADGNTLKCNCPGGVTRTDATGCEITATECDKQNPRCTETGGSCSANGNILKCNCPGGVTRTDATGCEITATECNKQNPRCTETGGSCAADGNRLKCNCPGGVTHTDATGCEKKTSVSPSPPPTTVDSKTSKTPAITTPEVKDYCKEVCGEDSEVKCGGDKTKKDKVICTCTEEGKDFDATAKECKIDYCKEKCKNEKCTGNKFEEEEVKCSCTNQDKDFIEKEKICKTNFCRKQCGNDANLNCEDEYKDEKKTCSCNDGYLFVNKKCKKKCSDDNECKHEGKCKGMDDNSKLCECKSGLSGDNCQIIDKCVTGNYKNCKESRGECVFEEGKAKCKCPEGKELSEKLGYCEDKCSRDNPCKGSNRECNSDGFCICTKGYEGVDCLTVTGCDVLGEKCKDIETECVLDENNKIATCRCKTGFSYKADENKCLNSFCFPNNPCKNGATCSNDHGFCECNKEDEYYNYQTEKCIALPDKCVIRKSPCSENEECKNGKCVCKYSKNKDEDCKRKCDKNKCFTGAKCSDDDDTCYCEKGKYYKENSCQDIGANCKLEDYKATCNCPSNSGTKRKENSKDCEPKDDTVELCDLDCGYGLCIKKDNKETCKCFEFATLNKEKKCVLKTKYCPGGKLQKDSMKCDCTDKLKQANDGITCQLKTCEDDGFKEKYESKGAQCIMNWIKGERIPFCPPGYEYGKDEKCSDACSYKQNIIKCASEDKFCYNSFSDSNSFTIECKCPPTVKEETGKCTGKAEYVYLIQNIPVMKKNYKSLSGVNKVQLNKDLTQSMKQAFGSSQYDYGYLYNYTISGDIVQCSFWLNLKTKPAPGDLSKINNLAKQFKIKDCDYCDGSAVVLAPGLILGEAGLKNAKISQLQQGSDTVMDNLCGKETFWRNGECFCKDGFRVIPPTVKTIGGYRTVRCEDIDECADGSYSCPENTKCVNTIGSYRCDCEPGFKKEIVLDDPTKALNDKSKCVDMCTPSPCGKGKCSLNKDKSFNCLCSPGYGGSRCDRKDENYASAKKGTVVVGAVLGTILALAAVAFLYYIIKIRKNSGSEDFHPAPRMDRAEMTERRPVRGISNRGYE